jgi:hypothetical protein
MQWLVRSLGYGFFLSVVFTLGQPPGSTLGIEPKEQPVMSGLPAEPDEFDRREVDAYYDWRNNLFFRVFKLESMEAKPNYMTARRTYKVTVNRYGYEVAMTHTYPLFYWFDLDGDGEFEPAKGEMWIDIEEDGINGNERPYDPMSPGPEPRGPVPVPPVPRSSGGAVGSQPL